MAITFNKKEKEKKKLKKRQDKAEKMAMRKANAEPGQKLEDMLAYVDENGNLSTTPPDPKKKKATKAEDIEIGISRRPENEEPDGPQTGRVTFYNELKGYGFIQGEGNGENVFFHLNAVQGKIKMGGTVSYESENSPKGLVAKWVKV
jgi:cold shock CspA family protein